MKKIILLAAGLFIFATATQAQETAERTASTGNVKHERMTPEQRAQKNVDEMDKIATLTADQKVKIKELALAKVTKLQDIRTKYKDQPEVAKKEQRQVKKDFIQSLKPILTPEQQGKLKASFDEQKAKRKDASPN